MPHSTPQLIHMRLVLKMLTPIPEQIARNPSNDAVERGNDGEEKKLVFRGNVAEFVDAYTKKYNQTHANGEKYKEFEDDDKNKDRNTGAKRVIDVILKLEVLEWHGSKTYSECANLNIQKMRAVLNKIAEEHCFCNLIQDGSHFVDIQVGALREYNHRVALDDCILSRAEQLDDPPSCEPKDVFETEVPS